MGVTDFLKREHEIVLKILDDADSEVAAMAAGRIMDVAALRKILSFLRDFLASTHQTKEDSILFPRVEQIGMPVFEVPLAILRREHAEGRERIRQLESALEAAHGEMDLAAIGNALQVFSSLLRRHMAREEEILFPLAESSLTPMAQDELERESRDFGGKYAGTAFPEPEPPELTPPAVPSSPPPEASP